MKRMAGIFAVILLFTTAVLSIAGCEKTTPTETTQQQAVPSVHTMVSTMYCTVITPDENQIERQFEAELDVVVIEHPKGNHSFDMRLDIVDEFWYDFTHSENKFLLQHEELDLPYYCAKASIYSPGLDGYGGYDFAVDFEKRYMIYKESTNITPYYVVASADPDVDPMQIAEHFSRFFQIYDYSRFDGAAVTDFYFDLYGTWLKEDGERFGKTNFENLGEMNFYITGTLPEAYNSGDEVEMELNFIWPEGSGYRNEGTMTYTGRVDVFEKQRNSPNFHGTGTLYDTETNEQIIFSYNIFPYDSTVIIYMNGQYLVGNLRYTSQVNSRLNYYLDFIFTTSE